MTLCSLRRNGVRGLAAGEFAPSVHWTPCGPVVPHSKNTIMVPTVLAPAHECRGVLY
jgi:hypothetical protein